MRETCRWLRASANSEARPVVPKVSDMQAEVTTTQVTTRGTMRTTMAKKSSTYSHHLVVREMVASYLDVCPAASTLQIMSSGKKRSDV